MLKGDSILSKGYNMSNSNICKIKGNKNSWKVSVKEMYKVDKCWLDHHKEVMQNTACVLGWAERSSSEAHLPSKNRRMKRNKSKKATPRAFRGDTSKIFHHSDTSGCLRMADQLLPKQSSLPSRGLPRIHLSATFLCAAGLLQASFSSLASWTILALTCAYLNS